MVPVIAALLLPMPKYFGVPQWLIFSILFSLVLLRVPCADIPRFRSIGWSPWLALLLIIPVVGFVVQLLLFFLPGKESNN
jgi:uncharacterized membrane protein YhaH (DUF805 family)